MDIWERMQSTLNQGLEASRDIFSKAKEKAIDLGEKGMLTLEIKQLENQLEKLSCRLGMNVYKFVTKDPVVHIDPQDPEISDIVRQMKEVEAKITEREIQLKKEN